MSEYLIRKILPFKYSLEDKGVYLVMVNVFGRPPHFLLNIGGKIYGSGVKGPTLEGDFGRYHNYIQRKNVPTLLFKLKLPAIASIVEIEEKAKQIVMTYPLVDIGIATCLSPIKDFVHTYYDTDTSNVNKIFDLLPKLESQDLIVSTLQVNMDRFLVNDQVFIKKYTEADIADGINKMRNGVLV